MAAQENPNLDQELTAAGDQTTPAQANSTPPGTVRDSKEIVIISHSDGSKIAVPFGVFLESYANDGYQISDEKPYTIEDMRKKGVRLDDAEESE